MKVESGCYLLLISVHGLIRGQNMELGRDADTGGQTKYVVELARALVRHPSVDKVDLVTRLVEDPAVDDSYARPIEELEPGANIVRIRCGPNRYLAKEKLWRYLDSFADNTLAYIRQQGWAPDLVHGHYADAGYVATHLAGVLNVPMAFTGHSLGRVKRQRLVDQGLDGDKIERRYNISRRIEAEENSLDHASFVVASTSQEVEKQYGLYDNYQTNRMVVIPPGVDLSRYGPPRRGWRTQTPIYGQLKRFLADPTKPMILALARPDPRKNLTTLVKAYGENKALQERANLIIVAGNRDDINDMDKGPRSVLREMLMLIDQYDLYGNVAYPKHHTSDEVPEFYRLAAHTKGVHVNPALTEPFGLTLIEAAASGLPIVATEDGGPRDITHYCRNGVLIDPLDADAIGNALLDAVSDRDRWRKWSQAGLRGVHRHFSWEAHFNRYMKAVMTGLNQYRDRRSFYSPKTRLITADRILVCDVDNTLTGDSDALQELIRMIRQAGDALAFGIATGRSREMTLDVLKEWNVPTPQLLITSVGSEIYYGRRLVQDKGWDQHISYRWQPDVLREAMADLPGLKLQPEHGQGRFKISYDVDPEQTLRVREITRYLRRAKLQANVIYSHEAYLDLVPIRASKGRALRYFATKWDIPLERVLVAGDSGNDIEMLTGNTLGVVVGNHAPEMEQLREETSVFFASGHHARGVIEGIEHYQFLSPERSAALEACAHE